MADRVVTLRTSAELGAIRQAVAAYSQLDAAQQKTARDAISAAQSMARLDAAMGNAAQGAARLKGALNGAVAIDTRQATSALNQLAALEKKVAGGGGGEALPRTFAGFTAEGATQLAGAYFGPQIVANIAKFTVQSGQAALSLRETQNSLRAVSGDVKTYENTLAIARQQQVLFGGSLEENIQGLTGLTITARQSGADLKTLVDLSQRLAVLDPSQGQGGARIAISEALSGDPTSLAKRYEIPKAALAKLRDESTSTADKLAVIDQYLNRVGITSATVGDRVDATAKTYRELGAQAERASIFIGNFAAEAGKATAIDLIGALGGGFSKDIKTGLVDGAIGVQNLLRSLQGLPPISAQAQQSQRDLADSTFRGAQAFAAAIGLSNLFTTATEQRTQAILRAADAEDRAAEARRGSLIAQQATTAATIVEVANKQALEAQGKLLEGQIKLQAEAYLALNPNIDAAGVASAVAANKIDKAVGDYINMQLAIARARDELGKLQNQAGLAAGATEGRAERDTPADRAAASAAGAQAAAARAAAAEEARRNQILRTGTAQQQVAERQRQYNEAIAKYGKNSAQAIEKQTALIEAQKAAANQRGAGGRGLSTLDRTSIELAGDYQAQLDATNAKLARGNLTQEQRNQLLIKARDLEEKIFDLKEKQQRAAVDAALAGLDDQRKRLEEADKLAQAQRILADGGTSEEQRARARLTLQEIPLEQQKRALEQARLQRDAGGVVATPGGVAPIPAGASAPLGPTPAGAQGGPQTAAQGGATLILQVDKRELGRIILDTLRGGRVQVQAAGG